MIITRTPFRISFAGGGSDLASYYRQEGGAVLSTTIDKYMYIVLHPHFDRRKIQLKYAKTELVGHISEIKHPIFREVLNMYQLSGVDINSIADIPSGTGMGSSSSFTVGLLNAVKTYIGKETDAETLATEACHVEIDLVGSPIGKQDQYAAAYGGLNFITFRPDDTVGVERIGISPKAKQQLERNLVLVYIGGQHSANEILQSQSASIRQADKSAVMRQMVGLAYQLKEALSANDLDSFGRILHEGWMLKRTLTEGISNNSIDDIYERGIKSGATGGKLLGAGGAGFILFYCPEEKQERFRHEMAAWTEMPFHFDENGSQVIYVGQ